MRLLAEGDRSCFNEAFELMWPIVRETCERLVGSCDEAEDLAQETLLKIFEQVKDYDPTKDAIAWTLTIAKFEFMTLRKRKIRRKEVFDIEKIVGTLSDSNPNSEERLINNQANEAILGIFNELDENEKETINQYLKNSEQPKTPITRKRFQRVTEKIRKAWKEAYG